MTEEFDVLRAFDILGAIQAALLLLILGLIAEGGIRLLRRWATAKNWRYMTVVLNALVWQPLFWSLLFGIGLPLISRANNPIVKEQLLSILSSIFLVSVAVIVVRIIANWLKLIAARSLPASVSIFNYLINGVAITIVCTSSDEMGQIEAKTKGEFARQYSMCQLRLLDSPSFSNEVSSV